MHLRSVLTALIVAIALYAAVFERERLRQLAGVQAPVAAPAAVGESSPAAAPVRVEVVASQARDIDRALRIRGATEAARQVEVRAETSGRVISAPIRKGAAIAAGDTLCEIDPGTRPATLAEAEARLAQAQVENRAANRLAEGGFASETRAASTLAELRAATAAVAAAETEIARLTVRAPFAGVLETDTAETGSLLQTGALCGTVLALDPIKLVGYLPQTAVDRVALGAAASARLATGREIEATVRFVARAADPATRTYRIELVAPNPDGAIRDGLSADIRVATAGGRAHLVPGSALTLDNAGTMGVRTVGDGDTVRFHAVEIVRDTAEGVYLAGLPETVRVIVTGQDFVTEGVRVTPVLRTSGGDT